VAAQQYDLMNRL